MQASIIVTPAFMVRLLLILVLFSSTLVRAATPIMPLHEVQPGMEGEWRTVIDREGLKTFRLKVLGIARNFIGPKADVIICEALDADQIESGPVAGMSGSPVYINGKLVGAYAYGYPLSKEQTLIGVQPIERMLQVLDYPEHASSKNARVEHSTEVSSLFEGQGLQGILPASDAGMLAENMRPLPLAISTSGFSEKTLKAFKGKLESLGLVSVQGASSGSVAGAQPLDPGMPVAGVLMSGDFSIAGTGTVTWREGDRILAFGHPFFKWGAVEIPMAGAEIITVVQNLVSSFKLSNAGEVVGTIYQDRQSAIAGEIGRVTPTTKLHVSLDRPVLGQETYTAEVMQDVQFTPLLLAMATLETLYQTMSQEREQTVRAQVSLNVEGYGDLQWTTVAGHAPIMAVFDFYEKLLFAMNNPFEVPVINSVDMNVEVVDGWHRFSLGEAYLLKDAAFEPGETVRVAYELKPERGEPSSHTLSFTLPTSLPSGTYTLNLMDASLYNRYRFEKIQERRDLDSMSDYFDVISEHKPNDRMYVVLMNQAQGVRVDGQNLTDLPASMRSLILGGQVKSNTGSTHVRLIKTDSVDVGGEFYGSAAQFSIDINP